MERLIMLAVVAHCAMYVWGLFGLRVACAELWESWREDRRETRLRVRCKVCGFPGNETDLDFYYHYGFTLDSDYGKPGSAIYEQRKAHTHD